MKAIDDRGVLRLLAREWLAAWPRCERYGCKRRASCTDRNGWVLCLTHAAQGAKDPLPGAATMRAVRRWLRAG